MNGEGGVKGRGWGVDVDYLLQISLHVRHLYDIKMNEGGVDLDNLIQISHHVIHLYDSAQSEAGGGVG